jgi:isopropylmalate/homocitrate/citramalate synthase
VPSPAADAPRAHHGLGPHGRRPISTARCAAAPTLVHLAISVSDMQIERKLGKSRAWVLETIARYV